MPVSYLPLITLLLLISIPLVLARRSLRHAMIGALISTAAVLLVYAAVNTPGWVHASRASPDDPHAQYQYARWLESRCGSIKSLVLVPCSADFRKGYHALVLASEWGDPTATWMLGARLKERMLVPKQADVMSNLPKRGEELMRRAVEELGYEPPHARRESADPYWEHFRWSHPFEGWQTL